MPAWPLVCEVLIAAAAVVVVATGRGGGEAGEILGYSQSLHSRVETGQPGINVTGKWSWLDHRGQRHSVWYVADTGGFRAFGDLLPSPPHPPSMTLHRPLTVGVPVVVALPLLVQAPAVTPAPTTAPAASTLAAPAPSSALLADEESSQLPKSLAPQPQVAAPRKEPPAMPQGKNFVAAVFGKMTTASSDSPPSTSSPSTLSAPPTSFTGGEMVSMMEGGRNVAPGILVGMFGLPQSDFVLLGKLRVPTAPKLRVGSSQLVPQPVPLVGLAAKVVTGLHSSGRPPSTSPVQPTQAPQTLTRLGIDLLNKAPRVRTGGAGTGKRTRTGTGTRTRTRTAPVPRPVRLVGKPSLDNFWRPARLVHTTTPQPSHQSHPSLDYDYQYYDYYDYPTDYEADVAGGAGGPLPAHQDTKPVATASSTTEEEEDKYEDDDEDEREVEREEREGDSDSESGEPSEEDSDEA